MKPSYTVAARIKKKWFKAEESESAAPDPKRKDHYWRTIGTAFKDEKTGKITVHVDCMPVDFDGTLYLFVPKGEPDVPF